MNIVEFYFRVLWNLIQFICDALSIFRADKDFRKTLVDSVPMADSLLKILLQEEGNAVSEASKSIQGATQKVIGVKDSIVGYFGEEKPAKPTEKPAPAKSMPHNLVQSHFKCFT